MRLFFTLILLALVPFTAAAQYDQNPAIYQRTLDNFQQQQQQQEMQQQQLQQAQQLQRLQQQQIMLQNQQMQMQNLNTMQNLNNQQFRAVNPIDCCNR